MLCWQAIPRRRNSLPLNVLTPEEGELLPLGLDTQADFALAFMMVHEVPDQRRLLGEIHGCLKPGGKLLVAEPKIHVPGKAFEKTMVWAAEAGLKVIEEPRVHGCRAVVFEKA